MTSKKTGLTRRHFITLSAAALATGVATLSVPAQARTMFNFPAKTLRLHSAHTDEVFVGTFWQNGHYNTKVLKRLNAFFRDHRSGQKTSMDPKLFDMLHHMQARLGTFGTVEIISGYRSPSTNRWLASTHTGVAKHSYHIVGKAMDIRIKGMPCSNIHRAALSLRAGGVGYYPESNFVHIDTGPLRTWGA